MRSWREYLLPGMLFAGALATAAHPDGFWRLDSSLSEPKVRLAVAPASLAQTAHDSRSVNRPLSFEANFGQTDSRVKFLARTPGYTLYLTSNEAVLAFDGARRAVKKEERSRAASILVAGEQEPSAVVRMKLVGSRPRPEINGLDELPARSNYFVGGDPKKWRTGVLHYRRVRYQSVYPGIDLVYYGNPNRLEFDFIVSPGSDPAGIEFAIDGADKVELDKRGNLLLTCAGRQIYLNHPLIYQEAEGVRTAVLGGFVIRKFRGGRPGHVIARIGFEVADYDRFRMLVIDPVLSYSTYFGGSDWDHGHAVTLDGAGNIYLIGETRSADFPTTAGAFQPNRQGSSDAVVTKLNASGSSLVYSTFLGAGTAADRTTAFAMALDSSGNAFVTGYTSATNFPTTPGAFQTTYRGGPWESFIVKLSATGSALVYSTYLGGDGLDWGYSVALDAVGNAYVAGYTESANFPITAGALQPIRRGSRDGYVTKLNSSGTALHFSTYLGGSEVDGTSGLTIDSAGNVYVVGSSNSPDLPLVNPIQPFAGGSDAFVAKLNPTGSALVYSTFLGGTQADFGTAVRLDNSGNVFVMGATESSNFPVVNAIQAVLGGDRDVFLAKLNSVGSALVYSTYLGGLARDAGLAISSDVSGSLYVVGFTESTNFPTANPFQGSNAGGKDAFVAKVNAAGSALSYSSYLGGSSTDVGFGIFVDSSGNCYVTGDTDSSNFPTTAGAFRTPGSVGSEVFLSKIGAAPPMLQITMSQQTYLTGDAVTATEFRLRNPESLPVKVEIKCWLVFPDIAPISVLNVGADGSFELAAGFDNNLGPTTLFPVTAGTTRGSYELNSRMLVPVTGKQLSEDLNTFVIQ